MPILDGRTLIDDAEGAQYVDLAGGGAGVAEPDIFILGTQSQGFYSSTGVDGLMHDAGGAQDWSGNVFSIWFNCGVAGLLDIKANGGIRMRFAGATITDYFEVFVDGSDTYSGGWKLIVVDIDEARRLATAVSPLQGSVGGTTPATSAIQYVGITTITAGVMPRMVDNTWVDGMWRLPVGDPGIIVGGDDGGSPYDWADVLLAADVSDPTKAWGSAVSKDGIITLNTPVQFAAQASPDYGDHDFEDLNKVIAWENNVVLDGFYNFKIVTDGINTQRFVAGTVSGTVGSQGWTVTADPTGPRWDFIANDPGIERVDLFGCSFQHTRIIDVDNRSVVMRTTLLIDGLRLWHSRIASPRSGALLYGNTIINADPIVFDESPVIGSPADVAYIWTADPDQIQFCAFLYFAGHAIKFLDPGEFDFTSNTFDDLWNNINSPNGQDTAEAALYNEVGAVILNIVDGDTPTFLDKQSPGTTLNNNVNVTLTSIVPFTEVRVYLAEDFTSPIDINELAGIEDTGSPAEFTFSAQAGTIVDIVVFNVDFLLPPNNRIKNFVVPTTSTSFPISQIPDRNVLN